MLSGLLVSKLRKPYRTSPSLPLSSLSIPHHLPLRLIIFAMEDGLPRPSIIFSSLYLGLAYATFYTFFQVFPLVYGSIYGMILVQIEPMFLTLVISIMIAEATIALDMHFVINKSLCAGKTMTRQERLLPALSFPPHPCRHLCLHMNVSPVDPLHIPHN